MEVQAFASEFSNKAKKYIKRLDESTKKRVREKIEELEKNPFPQDVCRVEGFSGEHPYRVRIGDQRLLYLVKYNPNKIIVINVDKRGRVYK
jgi:mRNA-degrading endonuclease RelE of RelBE toxin-antitoxin system